MQATDCGCRLLPSHESNRLRLQAVAVIETAKARMRKWSPSRRSAALAGMSGDAAACECRPLPCPSKRSTAAVTKPFRAGVRRLQG